MHDLSFVPALHTALVAGPSGAADLRSRGRDVVEEDRPGGEDVLMRMTTGWIIVVAMLAGCGAFTALDVPQGTIDSCVRSSGFPDGTEVRVEQQLRTDNLRSRVLPSRDISQDKAYEINDCIEATVKGNQPLPSVAGVPQSVTTKTDGKVVTETYTYGTPPAKKASKKPAVTAKATPSYSGVPSCSLKMVGGTGYACAAD